MPGDAQTPEKLATLIESTTAEEGQRLQRILDAIPFPIFYKDERGRYLGCNTAFERFIARDRAQIIGQDVFSVAPTGLAKTYESADKDLARQGGVKTYESNVVLADGTRHDVVFSKTIYRKADGSFAGVVGTIIDITERKKAERALEHLAFHDPLTGLPNRVLFMDHLKRAVAYARRHDAPGALAFIDLDRFKWVNDSLGHDAGDRVLMNVSGRLRGCLRETDTLARLGGDEFIALLPAAGKGAAGAIGVAERMLAELAEPMLWRGQQINISASIGLALFPHGNDDAAALIRRADAAMYEAKQSGNAWKLASFTAETEEMSQLRFETELIHAIDNEELRLYLQPTWSLPSRSLAGFEALVKWEHPRMGLIPASQFVPFAEQSGHIAALSAWMLRETCRRATEWRHAGLQPGTLAVNISALLFQRGDLVELITKAINGTGLPPSQLVLEITESIVMPDPVEATRQIDRLRRIGFRVAIDDFGMGYSNLNALRRLPIDQLKLDRSFIEDLARPDGPRALVEAMISLARGLKLELVAEGVESHDQLEALEKLGCPLAQGYFLGLPMPASAIADWLRHGRHPLMKAAPPR